MISRVTAALAASFLIVCASGCADKTVSVKPVEPTVQVTNAQTKQAPPPQSQNVGVSDDIAKACRIQFSNVDTAPKFDFDQVDLVQEDRSLLSQVATCVTTGPLKGHALTLVGHTDARGEAEYNMSLGEHRADTVRRYLTTLGVATNKVNETSRGKIDATGSDDSSWRRDRRVDVVLQ